MRMHALSSFGLRFSRALLLAGLILFSFAGARAAASEIIVQTDSIIPGVTPPLSGLGLPAGFRIGNVLTAPVDGTIVGVQILWGSQSGNAAPSPEAEIRITLNNFTPTPTTILATIDSPTLIDGGINEFRFLDPTTNLIPLAVPISAGTSFIVDLQLGTAKGLGPGVPVLLVDWDNTQGENYFSMNGFSWTGPFSLALPPMGEWIAGDVGIRAIIQPVPEPSAYVLAMIGAAVLFTLRRRIPGT